MNALDETKWEYVQIEEDNKALNMTDTYIHTWRLEVCIMEW